MSGPDLLYAHSKEERVLVIVGWRDLFSYLLYLVRLPNCPIKRWHSARTEKLVNRLFWAKARYDCFDSTKLRESRSVISASDFAPLKRIVRTQLHLDAEQHALFLHRISETAAVRRRAAPFVRRVPRAITQLHVLRKWFAATSPFQSNKLACLLASESWTLDRANMQ